MSAAGDKKQADQSVQKCPRVEYVHTSRENMLSGCKGNLFNPRFATKSDGHESKNTNSTALLLATWFEEAIKSILKQMFDKRLAARA